MSVENLLKLNVNEHTEKKNGLTYLSWAWAWAEALKADPKATFKVEMQEHGGPLMPIGETFMVWVTVTMFDKPMTCMLPVLDYRNKPIFNPNSFDVNTSIMRCLVKGIAMHGLGLYIYAGEDLPMQDTPEPVKVIAVDDSGKPKAEFEVQTESQRANDELFCEAMIEYSTLVKDLKDLNSYWKANQATLDNLKVTSPDLYAKVRDTFSTLKATFSKE